MTAQHMRRWIFRPYLPGRGPVWTLDLYDTGRRDHQGRWRVGYRLHMREHGRSAVLFEGDDFCPSPMIAIDSDESARDLMAFLTLRPGDTDAEYFEGYTAAQLDFAEEHGESLMAEVSARFGEEY